MSIKACLLIAMLIIIQGCVGTVEDKNPNQTKGAGVPTLNKKYQGLVSIKGISDSSIEVKFSSAAGDPSDLIYQIFVNDSLSSINLNGKSLIEDVDGNYNYTLKNLRVNSIYKVRISVFNVKENSQTSNDPALSTKTLNNETCNFNGIDALNVPLGAAGNSTVNISWAPAKTLLPLGTTKKSYAAFDPVQYRIYYMKADPTHKTTDFFLSPKPSYVNTINVPQDPLKPAGVFSSTNLALGSNFSVSGLSSETNYYFMVRCFHKGFFGSVDVNYKSEENTKILQASTSKNIATIDFNAAKVPDSIQVTTPAGTSGYDGTILTWPSAKGNFDKYIIAYRELSAGEEINATSSSFESIGLIKSINDTTQPTTVNNITINDTNTTSYQFSGLTFGKYYIFRIFACKATTACADIALGEAEGSSIALRKNPDTSIGAISYIPTQIVPKIISFGGISSVSNPINNSQFYINLSGLDKNTGLLNSFDVYCSNNSITNLATATKLDDTATVTTDTKATGASICDNLQVKEPTLPTPLTFNNFNLAVANPATLEVTKKWDTVTKLEVSLSASLTSLSNKFLVGSGFGKMCFAVIPKIKTTIFTSPNPASFLSFCINPVLQTPRMAEFPGMKSGSCVVDEVANKVKVSIENDPTGGEFSAYRIFFSDDTIFDFSKAKTAFSGAGRFIESYELNATPTNLVTTPAIGEYIYSEITNAYLTTPANAGQLTFNFDIKNFEPGKTYQFATLTTNINGADQNYSEDNMQIISCTMPKRKALFTEWKDIFAIGSKTDGLFDQADGSDYKILESLDLTSEIPLEVPEETNSSVVSANISHYQSLTSNNLNQYSFPFSPGLFDPNDDFSADGPFSRTGIVKLKWKDFNVDEYGTTVPFKALLTNLGISNGTTSGYKVFRSTDGGIAWSELPLYTIVSPSTTPSKNDYLFSNLSTYTTRKGFKNITKVSNNLNLSADVTTTNNDVFGIIDYSVKSLDESKARILYYKIVPYLNGKPILMGNTDNVVKILLPPSNMALVKREMANKATCTQLNLPPTDGAWSLKTYYSCEYKGISSSNPFGPWGDYPKGSYYDVGGDLLVDRFELGCNFSRNSADRTRATAHSFSFTDNSATNDEVYKKSNLTTLYILDPIACDANNKVNNMPIGASSFSAVIPLNNSSAPVAANCTNTDSWLTNMFPTNISTLTNTTGLYKYTNNLTPSYSVAYVNNGGGGSSSVDLRYISPKSNGTDTASYLEGTSSYTSSCLLNLSFNKGADQYPRWLDIVYFDQKRLKKHVVDIGSIEFTSDININLSSTINDIEASTDFYGGAVSTSSSLSNEINKKPSLKNIPIGKLMTSNSAKLPPLRGVDQRTGNNICNQYVIETGIKATESSNFVVFKSQKKRLLSKKEFTASSMWPSKITSAEINKIEHTGILESTFPADLKSTSCNSKTKQPGTHDPTLFDNYYARSTIGVKSQLITGSSIFDYLNGDTNSTIDNSTSTEHCQSRYGIQDMVGNVSESGLDQIYCNVNGQNPQIIHKASTHQIAFPISGNSNGTSYNMKSFDPPFVATAPLQNMSCTVFGQIDVSSGSSQQSDNTYVVPAVDLLGNKQPFATYINTLDTSTLENFRDALGFAIGFGPKDYFPSLFTLDSMALKGKSVDLNLTDPTSHASRLIASETPGTTKPERATPEYFSPVLGIPVNCSSQVNNTCANIGSLDYTSQDAVLEKTGSPNAITSSMKAIPTYNSQIYNDGLLELNYSTPVIIDPQSVMKSFGYYYILFAYNSGITTPYFSSINGNSSYVNSTLTNLIIGYEDDLNSGTNFLPAQITTGTIPGFINFLGSEKAFKIQPVQWNSGFVARDPATPLIFNNGGSYNSSYTGRYSTTIRTVNDSTTGVRCAVFIKE